MMFHLTINYIVICFKIGQLRRSQNRVYLPISLHHNKSEIVNKKIKRSLKEPTHFNYIIQYRNIKIPFMLST